MFCPNCGSALPEGAWACGSCGQVLGGTPYAPAPNVVQQQPAPGSEPKRSKKGLVAVVAILAVAAIGAGVAFALNLFGDSPTNSNAANGNTPIYVLNKSISYDSDGKTSGTTTYELDEHGNIMLTEGESLTIEYARDEYGNITESNTTTMPKEGKTNVTIYRYENELDKDGRLLSRKIVDDTDVYTNFEYYDDGTLKEQTTYHKGSKSVFFAYNERGFIEAHETYLEGELALSVYYEWEYDSDGNPESCTKTTNDSEEAFYSFKCDKNGNIVQIVDENEDVVKKLSYSEIGNPSINARSTARSEIVF